MNIDIGLKFGTYVEGICLAFKFQLSFRIPFEKLGRVYRKYSASWLVEEWKIAVKLCVRVRVLVQHVGVNFKNESNCWPHHFQGA